MNQQNILRSITEKVGLRGESIPGISFLEVSGNDRIFVENHICVAGYTDSEILIRVSFGLVKIIGDSLVLSCINKDHLLIRGEIFEIKLIK